MPDMIVPERNPTGGKIRLPPIRKASTTQKGTVTSVERQNGITGKHLELIAYQPVKHPQSHWHRNRTNQPAGLTTGDKDGFNVRTDKFATHWAKARADNADMFSRSKSDTGRDSVNKQDSDLELPKITMERNDKNTSASSVGRGKSNPVSLVGSTTNSGVRARTGSDHIPSTNTWAEVRRRRKALRERVVHSGAKHANNRDTNGSGNTNHQPYTNDLKQVTKLYTAMTVGIPHHSRIRNDRVELNRAQSNPESLNSDTKTTEYILSRREAQAYCRINKAYDNCDDAMNRQARFYQKLEDVQDKAAKLQNTELSKKNRENEEARKRHQRQLQEVRERHMEERMHRFSKQYVSSKTFENEESNRNLYGLPEEYRESVSRGPKKKTKKRQPHNLEERKKRNRKKFGYLFAVHFAGTLKSSARRRPKMEGIDTVVIREESAGSSVKGRKYSVQDIIKDARQVIRQSSQTDLDTKGRESTSTLDLEEEDLFEKARKKYGVNMDSDDEDMSDRKSL